MKPIKLTGPHIPALIVVSLASIGLYAVLAFASRKDAATIPTPNALSATAAPIDISKLHVDKISRVELGCEGAAVIAPDNEHYVCSGGQDRPGLWLGLLGKGLQKSLAEYGGPAAWLPDSRIVVYAEVVHDQPTVLYHVDVETGARTRISATTYPFGGDHVQVLPDGRVWFLERDALQVWDSTTKTAQKLHEIGCVDPKTQLPVSSYYTAVSSYYTAVSPDGGRVAEACAGSLYLIDISAGKTITLSDQVGIFVKPMAWSPDGRYLVYSVQPDTTRITELWIVNADGSSPRLLWRNEQARAFEWLTWMPDGQTLLFINNPGGGSFGPGYTFMAISVKGGAPKELFKDGESLQLFDDGRKILISRSVEDAGDWIVELAQ